MITIEKWQGLITNASPYALPGGAFTEQVNVQCLKPGQIESRRGYQTAATAGARVLSAVRFQAGTTASLLSFCDDGMIRLVGVT